MKAFAHTILALAVVALGFWAYQENYRTQAALKEEAALNVALAQAQARLDRLGAEWAYLNRPDRLRDLAEINFGRLQLQPMRPEVFARVADVAFPPASLGEITNALTVSSDNAPSSEEPL